ncbi:hypothetical protein ACIQUQ_28710 [Streptomyces sp. NPDC101118]|uniref:hypothetical protein n=1 Tax=Streptomyces sp. NPDC101118 TaxID=3366109 RepID=UPI0037F94E62
MTTQARLSATVAGVPLDDVMAVLRRDRPVFHSEADLQHGFARALWKAAPEVHSRLEVPRRRPGRAEYLDLLCLGPAGGQTLIEFTYFTRDWAGTLPGPPAEEYRLRNHGADDLARLRFVEDVVRLEAFCDRPDRNGLAILVTNAPALWTAPKPRPTPPRDLEFRLHEGRTLTGTLRWAGGAYPANTRRLRGRYTMTWQPYSELPGPGGAFRYLAVPVGAPAEPGAPVTG